MLTRLVCALIATSVLAGPTRTASAADALVHPMADPDKWEITGATIVSADAIRRGVRRKTEFLQVTAPETAPAKIAALVRELIERGYRHKGFAEAKIQAAIDDETGQLTVQIHEGPKYRRGDVRVTGHRQLDANGIAGFCQMTLPFTDRNVVLRINKDGKPDLIRNAAGKVVVPDENYKPTGPLDKPLWGEAKNQSLVETVNQAQLKHLKQAFDDQGFYFADYNFEVRPDAKTRASHLHIKVEDEGRPAVIRTIETRGLKRDSRESFLKFAEGQSISNARCRELESWLRSSGRYAWCACRVVPWDGETGEVNLTIDVREHPRAPKLTEARSKEQAVLLKAGKWLNDWERSGFDLVVDVQVADLIKHANRQIDEQLEDLEPEERNKHQAQASQVKTLLKQIPFAKFKLIGGGADGIGIQLADDDDKPVGVLFANGRKLLGRKSNGGFAFKAADGDSIPGLKLTIAIKGLPDNPGGQCQNLAFNLGFSSDGLQTQRMLTIDPAAMLDFLSWQAEAADTRISLDSWVKSDAATVRKEAFANLPTKEPAGRKKVKVILAERVLRISTEAYAMSFDERTGRLLSAKWGPLQIRTAKNALPHFVRDLSQALKNQGVTTREYASGDFAKLYSDQFSKLPALLEGFVKDTPHEWMLQLADYDVWRPAGDLLGTLFGDDTFFIPGQNETVENVLKQQLFGQLLSQAAALDSSKMTGMAIGLFSNVLMNSLMTSFDIFPVGSTPWIVNRELDLLIGSQGKSGFANVLKLQSSKELGPISGLYAMSMFGRISPYWRKPFAAASLKQIDNFDADRAWLLKHDSFPRAIIETTGQAFRKLDNESVRRFLNSWDGSEISLTVAEAIRQPLLRGEGPLTDAELKEFTSLLWQYWLSSRVEAALESVAWDGLEPMARSKLLRDRGILRLKPMTRRRGERDLERAIQIAEAEFATSPRWRNSVKAQMFVAEMHQVLTFAASGRGSRDFQTIGVSMRLPDAIAATERCILVADKSPETTIDIQAQLVALYALKARVLLINNEPAQAHQAADIIVRHLNEYSAGLKQIFADLTRTGTQHRLTRQTLGLAWWLSTAPSDELRDGRRALKLAKALQQVMNQPDAFCLTTLAAAHAEVGDIEKAKHFRKKALAITPPEKKAAVTTLLGRVANGLPIRDASVGEQLSIRPAGASLR